ncbi:MAG: hypothetical protein IPL53_09665 [Ignavibacteria bacterium]|nr:hypothetical protein [Ignavibacteria bacterium]
MDENYSQSLIICSKGASDIVVALYVGTFWSGSQREKYYSILEDKYPNYIIYNRFIKNKFATIGNAKDLEPKLLNSKKIIFVTNSQDVFNEFMENMKKLTNRPNASSKNVYSNKFGESIYELYLE